MDTKYNPDVLRTYAHKLLKQASSIVRSYVIVGVLIGYGVFSLVPLENLLFKLLGAAFVVAIAYTIGDSKALTLRLLAQSTLCFIQIEENTRE